MKITAEELRLIVQYDADTGIFTRLQDRGKFKAGSVAGTLDKASGYRRLYIDGINYHAHILAFLYMTGSWPSKRIDHRNRNCSDNRWKNLRLSSASQNGANSRIPRNNTSGFKGVTFCKRARKWRAHLTVMGRMKQVGLFSTKSEASSAREAEACRVWGEFNPV